MLKSILLLLFILFQITAVAQCIEKQISESTNTTYYLNARKQPTKVVSETDGEKSIFTFKYDAKGNCIAIDIDGEYKVKGVYNLKNQLTSTICTFRGITLTNLMEYKDNQIIKIKSKTDLMAGLNANYYETTLTYENGNITKMDVFDKAQDSIKTVIGQVTYDNAKRYTTKEETMVTLGFYTGNVGTPGILELSRNNPLKFSYRNLSPDENCGANIVHIEYEYKYDAALRVTDYIKKETCDKVETTENTKIERTCK